MISPDLPSPLKSALEGKLHGQSRQDAAARASRISASYRSGGNSGTISSEADAIAYATVRMPATYAAVAATLNALMQASPDFAPRSLLDVGAGPGTASFAAAEAFSSLSSFNAIDSNPALRTLALTLADEAMPIRDVVYALGSARNLLDGAESADLVIASYMIGELADAARPGLIDALWARTGDTLLVIEPGTPAGYQRIIAVRDRLIPAGAHIAAPCPHAARCPLIAPDWCHFAQRLARSRAHRELKGADVPFEDEKYSFVALARQQAAHRPVARVLAPPVVTKVAATAKLCQADGAASIISISRRDKPAFAAARRWDWGDGVETPPDP